MQKAYILLIMAIVGGIGFCEAEASVDSPGLQFASIKPGTFSMGADLSPAYVTAPRGIFIQDELPAREVTLTYPFDMSKYEITNAQYEQYDPKHAALRGKAHGLSTEDNEAVIYVNWVEAAGFCGWLSSNDTQYEYRLPTEAEWEYACRAGTTTAYNDGVTGDIYALNPIGPLAQKWHIITQWYVTRGNRPANDIAWTVPKDVDLTVGQEGPNRWGLYDMHGNVQEWTHDWYGPYQASDTIDPVGYQNGSSKAVRGGSHNVHIQTLRSANRSSSNRMDRHFLLGFRVVRVPKGRTRPAPKLKQPVMPWARDVSQTPYQWPSDTSQPYFKLVSLYDIESEYGTSELARQFEIPLYTHNHSPAITWCQNGDVLLAWFTGESEKDQALTVLALRGRRRPSGELVWDTDVSELYKEADRNMHGTQLWNNAARLAHGFKEPFTLYLVNGLCTDGRWSKLAMAFRTSIDHGVTWSEPVMMKPDTDAFHLDGDRNQPQGNAFCLSDGTLISFSDGSVPGGSGSCVNWSRDGGRTWSLRTGEQGPPGIHSSGVELNDGRIMAFSRDKGQTFGGGMPVSISTDQGRTFTSTASEFPSISTVMRSALIRLAYANPALDPEGQSRRPILLVSIAPDGIGARDAKGQMTTVYGTYAALSWDEGKTWPVKRVMSDIKIGSRTITMGPWNETCTLDATHGQPKAYWAATQTPDGMVHLNDSRLYYAFNLAWLMHGQ
ncbi:MAG: SUMF1/EgtB/PvdO family nonheme iron enzyme [Phycisphaerae bacterium]|nr:SUMF1/EgtB/PvdO family nonheme iron enzyme [Phycisphaerae bacterium]